MMPPMMAQIPSGTGMQLVRAHEGIVCVAPPMIPIVAEDPDEVLTAVAVWLEMRKPRKAGDDAKRYSWAARKILCPPGSSFMIAKVPRANGQGLAYILTSYVNGAQTPSQLVAWNGISALTHVHDWLTATTINPQSSVNGIRIETNPIDPESEGAFIVRIARTSTLDAEADRVPNQSAPWTLLCDVPMMRVSFVAEPLIEYVTRELESEDMGYFVARIRNTLLEIGQRVDANDVVIEGEGDDDDGTS